MCIIFKVNKGRGSAEPRFYSPQQKTHRSHALGFAAYMSEASLKNSAV